MTIAVDVMRLRFPGTFKSLQKLVMALAKARKSRGKVTFWGGNKEEASLRELAFRFDETLLVMDQEGVISLKREPEEVLDALIKLLDDFSDAYPNWQDAYSMAYLILIDDRGYAISFIQDRMRSVAAY